MDKVDAKTRETAVTLLDVLWTSKVAAGAAKTPTTSPASVVNPSASVTGFTRQVATNTGVIETAPTKTTLRHGFDTKGWGNGTTVQLQTKSHDPVSASKTANVFAKQLETASKLHQPEHDAQKMPQQRQQQQPQKQLQSSSTVPDSSYTSISPAIIVKNREHQLQRQNQEAQFEHQEPNTSSNTTTSMTISMTSVGFGIDNNNTSWVDATEATIKAVQDAMERSTLRFHTLHSHSLQIKIKLGVPCVRTLASPPGDSDSKLKQSHKKMEPMNVDLARLSSILPRVIPILPVQIEPGGLFVPGGTPGAPSICTVVACITLESQPQSSPSKLRSQPQTLPQEPVAPPLPPRPPLALEGSAITGFPHPKQALALASNSVLATSLSSREYNIVGGTVTASNDQQPPQHQNDEWKKKRKLQVDGDDKKGATKSIEILAMISEREINRRNILGAKGVAAAPATPTPAVLPSIAPINRNSNTSVGTGMLVIDSSATYQNRPKSSDQFVTPSVDQKLGSQIITTISKPGTPIIKPASARLPQNSSGKQSAKLVRSRVGGRNVSYSDYSNELPLPEERDCWAMSTRTTSTPVFPLKLHETLTQIEKDGLDDIIGWLPHGRSFKIHKQKEFTEIILPRYFVMTKKSSFLRQLNLYSFNRFSAGTTDKGSYYHEKFLRGRKFLSRRMTRQKVNGNRIRSAGNPDEEPDLSMFPICRDDDSNNKHHLSLSSNSSTSSSSLLATSGATGRAIVSTGDIPLSSSTPSSQASMIHAAPSSSDPSVSGPISGRNAPVGASPFLRVL